MCKNWENDQIMQDINLLMDTEVKTGIRLLFL
jgi:hypothetical protein